MPRPSRAPHAFAVASWMLVLGVCSLVRSAAAATIDVFVFNNQFSLNQPGGAVNPNATIFAGDSIRWVWVQGNHTTVAATGISEQWNSPINQAAQTFTRAFNNPGVYPYRCGIHGVDLGNGTTGGMSGTVTVLPIQVGACCLPDGTCQETDSVSCAAAGGSFQGAQTTCTANLCTQTTISLTLTAVGDAAVYEAATGNLANGAGTFMYAGNAATGQRRRALARFDLTSIPPGSIVVGAQLTLNCSAVAGAAAAVTAHRVLTNWGEGASDPAGTEANGVAPQANDVTWLHRFFAGTLWTVAGGDFVAAASASTQVAAVGNQFWAGAGMAADVQQWIDDPSISFGWMIRGGEVGAADVGKRFDTRANATAANRPRLTVTYIPVPTGACCLPTGLCDERTEAACVADGGTYNGDASACVDANCSVRLTPFVDALPLPSNAVPVTGTVGGAAHYAISMTEFFQQLHRDLPATRVWGYGGTYPGPTIRATRGLPVTVRWRNDLRVAETGSLRLQHFLRVDECLHGPNNWGARPVTVVHLHGAKVHQDSDGYPDYSFAPGTSSAIYTYPNDQPAATLWYHDHGLGITRLNVMMGLAGLYLLGDPDEAALGLPSGEFDVPLVIQDRTFNADGSFQYHDGWHDHFFGDTILVNGKVWPFQEVKRGKYRYRLVNGSNSRTYRLALSDGSAFWQIATEQALIAAPRQLTSVTIMPGERVELVIDFAARPVGSVVELVNSAPAPFPGFGDVGVVPDVLQFRVVAGAGHTAPLPSVLRSYAPIDPESAVTERTFDLMLAPDLPCPEHKDGMWMIDGLRWDDITERPVQGSTEMWTWANDSGISHPMHIHLVALQLVGRQAIDPTTGLPTGPLLAPDPWEVGWKDTVEARTGYFTSVIARFDGPEGLFPYHCHILEHEDHEMMRQFELIADCDGNGRSDGLDIAAGKVPDCDGNGIPDSCDIAAGAADANGDGIPDRCAACLADLDADGTVGGSDLAIMLGAWGACGPTPCTADINHDGQVAGSDLALLLGAWGACGQ